VKSLHIIVSICAITSSLLAQAKDQFEIMQLNPTIPGGREWFNHWGEGSLRTLDWDADEIDPQFNIRGNTNCTIFGSSGENAGQIFVTGSEPRLYVRSSNEETIPMPQNTTTWNNVEITLYAKTISAGKNLSYAGIEAVCKTNHCPDSDDTTTRGYGGRVLFDGRVDIEKELSHQKGSNIRSKAEYPWSSNDGGVNDSKGHFKMPLNSWVGYKFVVRNCDNESAVLLELYIDKTGGVDGGSWELVKSCKDVEYTTTTDAHYFSDSLWYEGTDFKTKGSASINQHGKPILSPNYSVYLRTDGDIEQYYKWFSVREISPVTGSTDLKTQNRYRQISRRCSIEGNILSASGSQSVKEISLKTISGKEIVRSFGNTMPLISIPVGIYIVQLNYHSGDSFTEQVVIR